MKFFHRTLEHTNIFSSATISFFVKVKWSNSSPDALSMFIDLTRLHFSRWTKIRHIKLSVVAKTNHLQQLLNVIQFFIKNEQIRR